MLDAKSDAGGCLSRGRTTDCTSVSDANFCPDSIFYTKLVLFAL